MVLILGLQSRIQEQTLEDRDRSWLDEVDLYNEQPVGDLYSFEFDNEEEPVSDSSEDEIVIGAPGGDDELKMGYIFLSTFVNELDRHESSVSSDSESSDSEEEELAVGADMPDYLFDLNNEEEEKRRYEEESRRYQETELSANKPKGHHFSKQARKALVDYLFDSFLDEDSEEVAVGSSDSSDFDNLLNVFGMEEDTLSQDNDDSDENDDEGGDDGLEGFKKMIMDIKAKESKNNPKVAEMKKDAVKEDNMVDKLIDEHAKKIGHEHAEKVIERRASDLAERHAKHESGETSAMERLMHYKSVSENPDLLKLMMTMKHKDDVTKRMKSLLAEQKQKETEKAKEPEKAKEHVPTEYEFKHKDAEAPAPPVLIVDGKELHGVLKKKGDSGHFPSHKPEPVKPKPEPKPEPIPPPSAGGKKRPVDASVFREIEALEKRMAADDVGKEEMAKLREDVNRLIARERQKDEEYAAKDKMSHVKDKMEKAEKERRARIATFSDKDLLEKVETIRKKVDEGFDKAAKGGDSDLEAEVTTMMRELGRSIMNEVDQKANSKAKLMAMELAKKMANEKIASEEEKAKLLKDDDGPITETGKKYEDREAKMIAARKAAAARLEKHPEYVATDHPPTHPVVKVSEHPPDTKADINKM